jgi:hypothetical protein
MIKKEIRKRRNIANNKTLKEKIEEDNRQWKNLSYSWISRINIVKMAKLLKAIFRLNAIPIKFPMIFSQK